MRLKKLFNHVSRKDFSLSSKLREFIKTRSDQLFRIPKYQKDKDLFADVKQFETNVEEIFSRRSEDFDLTDTSN